MHHIVVDIEATCWKDWENAAEMETIEIGAVKLDVSLKEVDEFSIFIRPVINPILSDFCTRFTSIKQSDVAGANTFPKAFEIFFDWIGPEPFVWYSWSDYDRKRLMDDLVYHKQPIPAQLHNHQDLKKLYADAEKLPKHVGMRRALKYLQIDYLGRQHRGIDDAKNTAEILKHVLAKIG
ncbi:MAG: 3'-5' exonuclease [Chloroflexota bacterium]